MKDKEMEKLIDACYDVMFQRQGEMEELGLLNYGNSSYYIQNPDEYEKDKKICELENEVERLEHRLSNCIEPKFIYGQYVWCVYPDNEHRKGFVFKMDFVGYTKDKIICCINENEEFDYDMVFATEEEAKAKLEELKNG